MTLRDLPFAVLLALALACGPAITVPPLGTDEVASLHAVANLPHGIYRIEPGDTIQIRYTFHPELDQQREIVRPDGKIRARDVGELTVAGLTTEEVRTQIVTVTSATLRDPEVTVGVVEFAPRNVYVAGEVGLPGPIPYHKGLTPVQAIIQAGGLRDTALPDSVVLIRSTEPPGSYVSRRIDVDRALTEGLPELLVLAPHDVVYVPRSGIAEANLWVDQHFTQLLPFFRGASTSVEIGNSKN